MTDDFMKRRLPIFKAVSKTVVDYCVMPGTSSGAEILWLYSKQWKNKVTLLTMGVITLVYAHMYIVVAERMTQVRSSTQGKV